VANVGTVATAPTSLASRSALHRFTVLLWTILTLRLKTSRSSVRSMRPNARTTSIAQIPLPTLVSPTRPRPTTRTDSHFLIFSQCSNNATNTSLM
jgi:hypothetical protein